MSSLTRVVVTGLGIVSPLGVGVEVNWRRLLENRCGIGRLNEPEYDGIPCRVAARVPISSDQDQRDGSLYLANYFPRQSDLKSMSLASAYALIAAQEAIEHSQVNAKTRFSHFSLAGQLLSTSIDRTRVGVSIGNGLAGLANTCATWDQTKTKGIYRGMGPYYITQVLANSCAGIVSIRHKLEGPNVLASPFSFCSKPISNFFVALQQFGLCGRRPVDWRCVQHDSSRTCRCDGVRCHRSDDQSNYDLRIRADESVGHVVQRSTTTGIPSIRVKRSTSTSANH